ncbi:sodium bile acid symporter family protein [Polyplosphaeria fusca]|uniref:Sodium bile acid symporter family protein n=1 Tax=Polyplosphaeria fusca TaxID=682080 RepID=A0A9P4QPU2_9PLEO|nr:sodium bile acid symporter family protein [Polyplosphaeria fusca]
MSVPDENQVTRETNQTSESENSKNIKDQNGDHVAPSTPQKRTMLKQCAQHILWFIKDQWFLITMLFLILIASQAQVPPQDQALKQTVINYLCVAIIFFINGCTIPTKILCDNLSRWKVHIFVQTQSYLLTSAISFGVASATAVNKTFMDADLLVGVIVLGCLPTAIAFNVVMTRKANGNAPLALSQTTISNLLGPFLSPALIQMYTSVDTWYTAHLPSISSYAEIYRRVFKSLGLSVFLPLAVGQILQTLFPKACNKVFVQYKLNKIGSLALLILIWQTYDEAFASHAFSTLPASNIVCIVFFAIALFLLWFVVALVTAKLWLRVPTDAIAVAFVVPTKTPAVGLPLTQVLFGELQPAQLARLRVQTVVFQAVQVACCSLLTLWLRRWGAGERGEEEEEEV